MPAPNTAPFQVIAGVVDVYVAPTGTTFPKTDVPKSALDTGGTWSPMGQTDGGVKAQHSQTIVELRTDQVTAPVKGVRSEESLHIIFSLVEMTLENYARQLNQGISGPTSSAEGTGTVKTVNLYRGGFALETFAFLCRGNHLSPYGDFNMQYEVPYVFQSGNPEVDYTKDAKALLACEYTAIAAAAFTPGYTDDQIFGVLRARAT